MDIRNRYTRKPIYSANSESFSALVQLAVDTESDLTDARLAGAQLSHANLRCAKLSGADLRGAELRGADLSYSELTGANLCRADLRYSELECSDLSGTDLSGANMADTNLRGANLSGADLRGADLTRSKITRAALNRADLTPVRKDIEAVLASRPNEVPGLLTALREGRVDGSTYDGECACLVGTIAKLAGFNYQKLPGVNPDSSRPAERWFLAIERGDTPKTNPISAVTVMWIEQWLSTNEAAP